MYKSNIIQNLELDRVIEDNRSLKKCWNKVVNTISTTERQESETINEIWYRIPLDCSIYRKYYRPKVHKGPLGGISSLETHLQLSY